MLCFPGRLYIFTCLWYININIMKKSGTGLKTITMLCLIFVLIVDKIKQIYWTCTISSYFFDTPLHLWIIRCRGTKGTWMFYKKINQWIKTKINPQLTWNLQHATKKSIYHKSSICTNNIIKIATETELKWNILEMYTSNILQYMY